MKPKNNKITKWLLIICFFSGINLQAATLDWDTVGWSPDGALNQYYTDVNASGIDINVTVTGDTDRLINSTPKLDNDNGNLNNSNFFLYSDYNSNSQSVTVTLKFSVPVQLSDLKWRDIDYYAGGSSQNGFDDKIIVSAKDVNGNTIYDSNRTLGSHIESNARGEYESDDSGNYSPEDSSAIATLYFTDTYVTELSFTYTNGDSSPDDPGAQAIWFDNFTFKAKDTDGDGVADFRDIDDDNDGILDAVEMQGGGTCAHGFFQVISGQLKRYDTEYDVYLDIGTKKTRYNALGYDSSTGKFYASVRASGTDDYGTAIDKGDLIEIDRYSGMIKKVYDGTDNTSTSAESSAADFYNGKYYFRNTDDSRTLYTWDTVVGDLNKTGSDTVTPLDFAIIGSNYAYGARTTDTAVGATNNTKLYTINLENGKVTNVRFTVTTPDDNNLSNAWGAAFVANSNELYLVNNNGYIFQILDYNTSTPTARFAYASVSTSSNDGASCRDSDQFAVDSDGDGIPDHLDLDSDNDGIPDNIEAQSTTAFTVPSGIDSDSDGLDDAYDSTADDGAAESVGLIPPDTDGDNYADFLDTDTDNDGYTDCEEGINPTQGENCPLSGDVGVNGLLDSLETGGDQGYTNVNNDITDPDPDNGSTDMLNEYQDANNPQAAYREFMCGKALTTLTKRNWKLISIPCNTGSNTIQDLLGNSLGQYGEPSSGGQWVMYRQSALEASDPANDNFEVNATHTNTNKTKLAGDDPVIQGVSYWIIWDDGQGTPEVNVTINESIGGISPTAISDASADGIDDPDFTKIYKSDLPDNDVLNTASDYKKFMAGNPFPYAFTVKDLYFAHDVGNGSYYPMGDNNNDDYINATFYKHDAPNLGPVTGYEAVNPATPGFANGGVKAMEGFFIKIEKIDDDTASNGFAYPLMMENGSGN